MTTIPQTYQRKAEEAAERAAVTEDAQLRFAWEQIALSYNELAKKQLNILSSQTGPGIDGRRDDATETLRASLLNSAIVCRQHAERMRVLALEESDSTKWRIMLVLSDQYHLLHNDLLALEDTIWRPTPLSGDGATNRA